MRNFRWSAAGIRNASVHRPLVAQLPGWRTSARIPRRCASVHPARSAGGTPRGRLLPPAMPGSPSESLVSSLRRAASSRWAWRADREFIVSPVRTTRPSGIVHFTWLDRVISTVPPSRRTARASGSRSLLIPRPMGAPFELRPQIIAATAALPCPRIRLTGRVAVGSERLPDLEVQLSDDCHRMRRYLPSALAALGRARARGAIRASLSPGECRPATA